LTSLASKAASHSCDPKNTQQTRWKKFREFSPAGLTSTIMLRIAGRKSRARRPLISLRLTPQDDSRGSNALQYKNHHVPCGLQNQNNVASVASLHP